MKNKYNIYVFLLFLGIFHFCSDIQAITAVQYGAAQLAKNIDDAWNTLVNEAKKPGAKINTALEQRVLRSLEALKTSSPTLYKKKLTMIQEAVSTDKSIRHFTPQLEKTMTITSIKGTRLTPDDEREISKKAQTELRQSLEEFVAGPQSQDDVQHLSTKIAGTKNILESIEDQYTGYPDLVENFDKDVQLLFDDILEIKAPEIKKTVEEVKQQDNTNPFITNIINQVEDDLKGGLGTHFKFEDLPTE